MLTIIETPIFSKIWPDYWSEDERGDFVTWLALHPLAGDAYRALEAAGKYVGGERAKENVAGRG
jgi:hypothetical protein